MKKNYYLILSILLFANTLVTAQIMFNHEPGRYGENLSLSISSRRAADTILYRSLGYEESQFLTYRQPITVTAAGGTRQRYLFEVVLSLDGRISHHRVVEYIIDKEPPLQPLINLPEGEYDGALSIRPMVPSKPPILQYQPGIGVGSLPFAHTVADKPSRIRYSLVGLYETREGEVAMGDLIDIVGESRELRAYDLILSSVDEAGNISVPAEFRFRIDRRHETMVDTIAVLSPVEGTFANRQLLYIDDGDFAQLRYSVDGSDPRIAGASYDQPVLLPSGRGIRLRVYGITQDGRELRSSLRFTAGDRNYGQLKQGRVREMLVSPLRAGLYYRQREGMVSRADEELKYPVKVATRAAELQTSLIRILDGTEEYRYFFILDGRPPADPRVSILSFNKLYNQYRPLELRATLSPQIMLRSVIPENERMFYTINGVLPSDLVDAAAPLPPAVWELSGEDEFVLPAEINSFTLSVQSVKNDLLWSKPVRKVFTVARSLPETPDLQLASSVNGFSVSFSQNTHISLSPAIVDPVILPAGFAFRLTLPAGIKQDIRLSARAIDVLGNSSAMAVSRRIAINSFITKDISIQSQNGKMTISGPQGLPLFYRFLHSHQFGDDSFRPYSGPVDLPSDPMRNSALIVEVSQESSGATAGIVRSAFIPVHNVPPAVPIIGGISPGERIGGNKLIFSIADPEPEVDYYYSLAKRGEDLPDPFTSGKQAKFSIILADESLQEDIRLGVIAVSSVDKDLRSPINEIQFYIDNAPPAPPVITGASHGAEYSTAVEISLHGENDSEIFYQLQRNGESADGEYLAVANSSYDGAIMVEEREGKRAIYSLEAYTKDVAGNQSDLTRLSFAIDRLPPSLPTVRIFSAGKELAAGSTTEPTAEPTAEPATEPTTEPTAEPVAVLGEEPTAEPTGDNFYYISNAAVALFFEAEDEVVYEIRRGSTAPIPSERSPLFDSRIDIDVLNNTAATYTFIFRGMDRAGNLGPPSEPRQVLIDRERPLPPPLPGVERDGNSGVISWPSRLGEFVEYLITARGIAPQVEAFSRYTSAVVWEIPDWADGLVVYYRSHDGAGNTSSVASIEVPHLQLAPIPKLIGIQDGAAYTENRYMEALTAKNGEIRYEVSSDGSPAQLVSETSLLFDPAGIEFTVGSGLVTNYNVKMRQYIDGYQPSPELNFSFSIDQLAPSTPTMRNIAEKQLYSMAGLPLDFFVEEDGRLLFQVDEYVYEDGQLVTNWGENFTVPDAIETGNVQEFLQPGLLGGYPDELTFYAIRAEAYDQAGNRSEQDGYWNIVVDRRNIFVQDGGSGRGSPADPLGSMFQALNLASREGRGEIHLSAGNHPLSQSVRVDRSITIYGGYDASSWERNTVAPSYFYGDKSLTGGHLLRVGGGAELVLNDLQITHSALNLAAVISVQNAKLAIINSAVTVRGRTSAVLAERDSSLSIVNSKISGYELIDGRILNIHDSDVELSNSRFSAEEASRFLREVSPVGPVLLYAQNSQLTVDGSTFLPGIGETSLGIHLLNSAMEVGNRSLFTSGYGKTTASAFLVEGSRLELRDSQVVSFAESEVVSLLVGHDSDVVLNAVDLRLNATFGVNGFLFSGGSLEVANSRVRGGGAEDFVKGIIARNGVSLNIHDTEFYGAPTADYALAVIENGTALFVNNRLELSGGEAGSAGLKLGTGNNIILRGNTFIGTRGGTAIHLQGSITNIVLEVSANNFDRWSLLLEERPQSRRNAAIRSGKYKTFSQLSAIELDNASFNNNIVN